MKHLRNLIMLLAMLCMTLTSCLNSSSEDYTTTAYGIVEVVSSMGSVYFKASNGTLIYPTATSLASVESKYSFEPTNTHIAYIGYEYDAEQNVATSTSMSSITLTYAVSLDGKCEDVVEEGASNDSVATAPIIGLTNVMSTSSDKMYVMNNRYLVTGINYYFYQYAHYFTLVYYEDDQDDSTVLKLHLRHSGTAEPTSVTTTSYQAYYYYGYVTTYFWAFDLLEFPISPEITKVKVIADTSDENLALGYATETEYSVAFAN